MGVIISKIRSNQTFVFFEKRIILGSVKVSYFLGYSYLEKWLISKSDNG